MKKFIGCLYGIFLERLLEKITVWKSHVEKGYLGYCTHGCANCYAWKCCARTIGETPYKKFRRPD